MRVVTSRQWYSDHLEPIVRASMDVRSISDDVVLVASYPDLVEARRLVPGGRYVLAQHGAGQSYSVPHPHYPGGVDHDDVGLFLVPGEYPASRWRDAYPRARAEAVGSPRLDALPRRDWETGDYGVVALAWHWDYYLCPEGRSALRWYRSALPALARQFRLIGTGHPRRRDLAALYADLGIEFVPDFGEVSRRADVLVFDNTSAGFEFAATGRPVVVLDAPWYNPETHHGLRFWEAADVGIRVGSAAELPAAIHRALQLRPEDEAAREVALERVYAYRTGAARRAAEVISEWAGTEEREVSWAS